VAQQIGAALGSEALGFGATPLGDALVIAGQ